MDRTFVSWLLLLGLGFPLVALLLNEAAERLDSSQAALASALRKVLHYVLPPLAIFLVMSKLLEVAESAPSSRIVESMTWLAVVVAGLSLINATLTTSSSSGQKRLKVPNLFFQVARALTVLGIGFYITGGIWAVDLSGIVTAVGVSSLVVALALQDTLSNLVSGLLLLIAKPFKTGDWIVFNGTEGRIIEQNWWGVTLEYVGWEKTVTVPNGVLAQATIDNFGPDGFWYSVDVEFSYDDPPDRVLAALSKLNQGFEELEIDKFLFYPDLYPVIKEFGASGILYRLWFKRPADRKGILFKNTFFTRIYYMAQREGFTIPYPISVEYAVESPNGIPATIPQALVSHEARVMNHLRTLLTFQSLEQEDIDQIASKARLKQYAPQDVVIEEGSVDEGLYSIVSGSVQVRTKNHTGESQIMSQLNAGDVFGEMALFPGELSPITVIAESRSEIVIIDVNDIVQLIQFKSKFGFEMTRFIEGRRRALNLAKGIFEDELLSNSNSNGNRKIGEKISS